MGPHSLPPSITIALFGHDQGTSQLSMACHGVWNLYISIDFLGLRPQKYITPSDVQIPYTMTSHGTTNTCTYFKCELSPHSEMIKTLILRPFLLKSA